MAEQIPDNNNGNTPNSWATYQRLIIANQDRHETDIKELKDEVGKLKTNIAVLKSKAAMIGAGAGILATGIIEGLVALLNH